MDEVHKLEYKLKKSQTLEVFIDNKFHFNHKLEISSKYLVGKNQENDIKINHTTISDFHLIIILNEKTVQIKTLSDSLLFTSINQQVKEISTSNSTKITLFLSENVKLIIHESKEFTCSLCNNQIFILDHFFVNSEKSVVIPCKDCGNKIKNVPRITNETQNHLNKDHQYYIDKSEQISNIFNEKLKIINKELIKEKLKLFTLCMMNILEAKITPIDEKYMKKLKKLKTLPGDQAEIEKIISVIDSLEKKDFFFEKLKEIIEDPNTYKELKNSLENSLTIAMEKLFKELKSKIEFDVQNKVIEEQLNLLKQSFDTSISEKIDFPNQSAVLQNDLNLTQIKKQDKISNNKDYLSKSHYNFKENNNKKKFVNYDTENIQRIIIFNFPKRYFTKSLNKDFLEIFPGSTNVEIVDDFNSHSMFVIKISFPADLINDIYVSLPSPLIYKRNNENIIFRKLKNYNFTFEKVEPEFSEKFEEKKLDKSSTNQQQKENSKPKEDSYFNFDENFDSAK